MGYPLSGAGPLGGGACLQVIQMFLYLNIIISWSPGPGIRKCSRDRPGSQLRNVHNNLHCSLGQCNDSTAVSASVMVGITLAQQRPARVKARKCSEFRITPVKSGFNTVRLHWSNTEICSELTLG